MKDQNGSNSVLYDLNDAYQAVTEEEIEEFGANLKESKTDEIEIADATEEVKRFTVLADKVEKEAEPLKKEYRKFRMEPAPDEEKGKELSKKIDALEDSAQTYRQIASHSARRALGYPQENLDIRKDWKIVTLPEKKRSGIEIIGIGIGSDDLEFLKLMNQFEKL